MVRTNDIGDLGIDKDAAAERSGNAMNNCGKGNNNATPLMAIPESTVAAANGDTNANRQTDEHTSHTAQAR